MLGQDSFDDLVAGFYRAAAGNIAWVDALWPFADAVSAIAVHLHAVDVRQGRIAFSHAASRMPAEAEFEYIRHYHRIDPRASLVLDSPPGLWMNCWEHFNDDFVTQDRFYQDFLIPYGGRYVSGVKLLQTESLNVVLGVHRGNGDPPLGVEELLLCKRLARHVTEALNLHFASLESRQQGLLGSMLLSRLRTPAALIDGQRRLLSSNPAARKLLASPCGVFDLGGRMHCLDDSDDEALLTGVKKLLRDEAPMAAGARTDKLFLRLRLPRGQAELGLYVCALRPQETLHAFGDRPVAMVLFHEAASRIELDPFLVAAAYDLTPAEARVAVLLARGAAPDDIAEQSGLSIHTVRSQLATIYHKTGSSRQAELVSVLGALPMAALAAGC